MGPRCRRLGMAVAVLTVVIGLAACGDGEDRPGTASGTGAGKSAGSGTASGSHAGGHKAGFSAAEADTVAKVILRDFAIQGIGPTVKGPKVFFEASNQGPADHELVIVNEDGREQGEIHAFKPGTEGKTLSVELKPGRYEARCLVRVGDQSHVQRGMEASFTVE